MNTETTTTPTPETEAPALYVLIFKHRKTRKTMYVASGESAPRHSLERALRGAQMRCRDDWEAELVRAGSPESVVGGKREVK